MSPDHPERLLRGVPARIAPDVRTPLCRSISATAQPATHPSAQASPMISPSAASSGECVSRTVVGQRPAVVSSGPDEEARENAPMLLPPGFLRALPGLLARSIALASAAPIGVRHPSTLRAPVPCRSTLAATVPSSDLRATTIGSAPGLSWVFQPDHRAASSVDGAVSFAAQRLPHRPV